MLGQYEIISPLGIGGMGEVYRARDSRLHREVAIKVLPQLISLEQDRLFRFEQEARAAAALNHPNILSVYQMGTYLGIPYMVSELLEGKTLGETLSAGPLPLRKVIDYGPQIARGLAAAHEKGIVHRDLKPDNIFLTKDGRAKILDFGLAKVEQPRETGAGPNPTVTVPGITLGTVGYMAPEQVRGLAADSRSDIFSFGVILYEMILGQRAFHKPTSADTMSAILNEEPRPLSQLAPQTPAALERLVRRCLEKYPEQRFQSASDLAFALEALTDPTISSVTAAHLIRAAESKRSRVPWLAAGVAAILVVAGFTYWRIATAAQPTVSNYVQLTHDGQPKSLIGTDNSRLYVGLGTSGSGSFVPRQVAEVSVSGGEPRKLPISSSPDIVPVDLSADGAQILAIDGKGAPPKGPLWSFPVLGGSPRRLGDNVAETAAWSPDGNSLAFSSLGDLFVAKSDGSDARKLLTTQADIKNVAWSPDGQRLQFDTTESSGTVGQQILWEVGPNGANLHHLIPEGEDPHGCCGRWTRDGEYFVYQSNGQIWALAESGGLLPKQVKPIALTASPLSLSSPLPSKDGSKLFVVGQTYRGALMRYDGKTAQFSPFLGGLSGEYVSFSNDGQWLAYVSFPDGTLQRSKVDGSERLQLTYPPGYPVLPRWSPDGKNIVFFEFAVSPSQPSRIYEVSADGGSPHPLLPSYTNQQLDPNWSPDGSKIVFGGESNNPRSAIHIIDMATRQVTDLPGSQGFYSPRWSPDGLYISAFSSDSQKLLLFDMQTQKWAELASGSLGWLNWSHAGQYVYVLDFGGTAALVRIHIKDHKSEKVVDLKDFVLTGRYGGSLSLAPDDSAILLRDAGSQDVYSLDWKSR
jgi:serine/threonine protein kinase/Tol biopolymer transport system component